MVNQPSKDRPDFHHRYRVQALAQDRRHAALVTMRSVPPGVAFVISDFTLYGWSTAFFLLVGLRSAYAGIGLRILDDGRPTPRFAALVR